MSGEYSLTDEEESIIKAILSKHDIDILENEVSIKVSTYDDFSEDECGYRINIYVQVN